MSKHPRMNEIERKLASGKNFMLSRLEYINMTGADTPQNPYYTVKRSAVAKLASKYGYVIQLIPEKLVFNKE